MPDQSRQLILECLASHGFIPPTQESGFIDNGLPVFIKYNEETNSFESIEQIEETTRILTPPSYEECPYLRYEFENLEEINRISKFIDDNNVSGKSIRRKFCRHWMMC